MPSDNQLEDELSSPYSLTDDHHLNFSRDGFIRLPNVLSPGAVVRLREELINLLNKTFPKNNRNNRFLSLRNDVVRESHHQTICAQPSHCKDFSGPAQRKKRPTLS